MKIVKVIASFFILMLIGIFISYGDTDNSGYDKFLETFNNTQADFKFYNIKANGLINYDALSKMKNTAILVNMGRGPIVVERDLSKAIDEDKIRGAALDVFEVEPINEENPLLTVKNKDKLLLSPHIAWASIEARKVLFEEVIENIKAFYRGEERNRV